MQQKCRELPWVACNDTQDLGWQCPPSGHLNTAFLTSAAQLAVHTLRVICLYHEYLLSLTPHWVRQVTGSIPKLMCCRAFASWREFVAVTGEKRERLQRASRACFASQLQRAWSSWAAHVHRQRLLRRALESRQVCPLCSHVSHADDSNVCDVVCTQGLCVCPIFLSPACLNKVRCLYQVFTSALVQSATSGSSIYVNDNHDCNACQPGLGACGASLTLSGRFVLSDLAGAENRHVVNVRHDHAFV